MRAADTPRAYGRTIKLPIREAGRLTPGIADTSPAAPHGADGTDPLQVPYFDCTLVASPALRSQIEAARPPKLTTLSAPSGYGKTAFMVQFYDALTRRGHDCLWVSLAPGRAVMNPMAMVEQAVWRHLGTRNSGKSPKSLVSGRHAVSLHGALAQLNLPVLFLDDVQDYDAQAAAPMLEHLIFGTGALLRVVAASRHQLPIDQGRAQLQLASLQLGPRELALDGEGVEALLACSDLKLPPDTRTALLQASEGWPAGLRMMMAALARDRGVAEKLGKFGRLDPALPAFFRRHVTDALAAEQMIFLAQISLLNDPSADLAAAATGRQDASEALDQLQRQGVFIETLPGDPPRLRMHGLFRSFLAEQVGRILLPDERVALQERAASWCFRNGALQDAMAYGLAAPAPALVRDILESSARIIVSDRGDLLTFLDWVARANALGVEISIDAEFWHIWALAFSRRCPRARQRAKQFQDRLSAMPRDKPGVRELSRRMELLRIMLFVVNDELADARRAADEWLQVDPNRSPTYTATAALAATIAVLPRHNFQETRRYLQMAQVGLHHARGPHLLAWLATTKALVELEQGFPQTALQITDAASAEWAERIAPDSPMAATLDSLRARALLDLGRADEARELLGHVLRRCAQHGFCETTRHVLETAVALGDGAESGPFGFAALESIASDGSERLQRMLATSQIRRLSVLEEAPRALDIARAHGLEGEAIKACWQPSEALAITLARIDLLIAEGMARPALKLAELTLRQIMPLGLRREAVELHLTMARAHLLANDRASAVRAFSRAIALAASRHLLQPFLQQRQLVCDLLRSARLKDLALSISEQISFCQTLCDVTGTSIGQAFGVDIVPAGEVGALTRRELELLALLEAGPTNVQLAEDLLLSLQTVKWHLYNLYAKLGVKNRGAALAKARALKLLPGSVGALRA